MGNAATRRPFSVSRGGPGYRSRVRPLIRPLVRSFRFANPRHAAGSAVLLASWLVGGVITAVPASAAPTCAFDAMTATATIQVGNGESAIIARSGDAITLDGTPCGAATVTATDAIVVNGTAIPAAITIDLGGGAFAPGMSTESDEGDPEIEFTINLPAGSPTVRVVGSGGTDDLVVGEGGINLNAAEAAGDADVLIVGLPVIELDGGAGDDVLSVAGGAGTGAQRAATVHGDADGDQLFGGLGGSTFDGGDGSDTLDYSASNAIVADLGGSVVNHAGALLDQVNAVENLTGSPEADQITGDDGPNVLRGGDGADVLAGEGGDDDLDGQAGADTADYGGSPGSVVVVLNTSARGDGTDLLSGLENALGSPANDVLIGDGQANDLAGGAGDDRISGGPGADALDGGPGIDTVFFASADTGVQVDLRDGTSKGEGDDTLAGFEQVTGSPFADTIHGDDSANRLLGDRGKDQLFGHDGRDQVLGNAGADRLQGQGGSDVVSGGVGRDQLNGGDGQDLCDGGPDPDSFVFCEEIHLG